MAAPRRRRRSRRRHSHAYAPRHRHAYRRRHARRNPFGGGELALAFISGGIGFAVADFVDRYLATYDPSAASPPTDRFTGGTNGTLANTLNVASPPSILRIGAGVGVTAVFGLGAYVVKNSLGRAALQGAMLGAGINLFKMLWNAYVIGNLLKPAATDQATMQKSLGARLYPAEIVAAQNLAQSPVPYTAPQGLNRPPPGAQPQHQPPPQRPAQGTGTPPARDPGPFATTPAAPPAAPRQQGMGAPPPAAPAARPNGAPTFSPYALAYS